ncbi:MAG: glycosyltransferase [Deltaproteobacteria bacterium]|nr:glycosyltransferase [Deltaproteobacteria bacterium]
MAECLASLDAQTYNDTRVIAIDDGSTDATWDVIQRTKMTKPIERIRTENRGAHAALNHGLSLAQTEYVAICNSDDTFAPSRLERMIEVLRSENGRFAFSHVRYIDPEGADVSATWDYARDLHHKQRAIESFAAVGYALMLTNVAISTGNFVFALSLIDDVGHFRPYRYVHDWDFALRALLVTEPLYVPEALYNYRLHAANSFRSLDAAAAVECPELMRRFMKSAMTSTRLDNERCPSPANWPGYFEYFVQHHGYEMYQHGWDTIDPPYFAWRQS